MKYFNNPEKLWNLTQILLQGLQVTGRIFILTLVLSIPLGMLVAKGRMSKLGIVRMPISIYSYVLRSTPLML